MSRLAKYIQSPEETKRYSIEYSDWLDTGENLADISFEITPTTSPALSVLSSNIVLGDTGGLTQLRFFVTGGVAKNSYKIIVNVATSGGQEKQDTVLFDIRDAS